MIEGDIKKIFVVGAGVMGHGLAQSFAEGGYQVSLFSRTQKTLDRARGLIESSLNTKAKEGLSDGSQIPAILDRITTTTSLEEGAHDADIALETVVENVQAKKDIEAHTKKKERIEALGPEGECPLCERELGTHYVGILAKLSEELQTKRESLRVVFNEYKRKKEELASRGREDELQVQKMKELDTSVMAKQALETRIAGEERELAH